ncbi:MAG: hypothetical protein PVSMB7_10680 [Chloroflexota bacterium]
MNSSAVDEVGLTIAKQDVFAVQLAMCESRRGTLHNPSIVATNGARAASSPGMYRSNSHVTMGCSVRARTHQERDT